MYRVRTRGAYSADQLREVYSYDHDATQFPDHLLRIAATYRIASELISPDDRLGADLSTGNAQIPFNIRLVWHLGDYRPGHQYEGPIEETIHQIPDVDLFLCLETIEHLDDPDSVLGEIRKKSKKLILSTPKCTWVDQNIEHYWAWDDEAVADMLAEAGWLPILYEETHYDPGYSFQVWGCV